MKSTLVRWMGALAAIAMLAIPVVGSPAQAAAPVASSARFLEGTWVAPVSGFGDPEICGSNGFCTGWEKVTITKVKGHAAKGTWQYRAKQGDRWSAPLPVYFVVRAASDGTWEVYGSDGGGTYEGVYTPWTGALEMAYMSPGDTAYTLYFPFTKK